jgi:acetoacetate decarboxylase
MEFTEAQMTWVKTVEEIKAIENRLAASAFLDGRYLTLTFLTRPEFIAQVLPPPLTPASQPLVSVGVATFGKSNCVGAFAGGAVNLLARYNNIEGEYCLAMPMSTDVAMIFGRELFGEPKKQARARLSLDGDIARGSVERFGIEYLSLEANLGDPVTITGPTHLRRFHFKFMHAANGRGLEFDPILVMAEFRNELRLMRRGTGEVIFRRSHHDPVSEIEIVELREAIYTEGDLYAKARRLTTVPAQEFLPYSFQNIDDYTRVE